LYKKKHFKTKKKESFQRCFISYFIKDYFIMANSNNNEEKEEQRPLGAVLGWLNLSPTLPNTQDNMTGATAGIFNMEN
jgi:hypothetical protein